MTGTFRKFRALAVMACALATFLAVAAPAAVAAPSWSGGEYMWYRYTSDPADGDLYLYQNSSIYTSMRAGSGQGNDECISDHGRLPVGWYSGAHEYHVHNKNNTIKGRVWGISDKACYNGNVRFALFIHTEETSSNGQSCPTGGDDPYCWDTVNDYKSLGCIKISHPNNGYPNSVNSLNNWWHNIAGGAQSTYYYKFLYVGSSAPSPPPQ